MKLFGREIGFGWLAGGRRDKALAPIDSGAAGWVRVLESYPGAWQRNVVVSRDSILAYHAVYACMTLIASDIAKLRLKLVEQDADGIWTETKNPAYSPVLRKPNRFQTRIQFWESWILSKLATGNVYVLKQRDARGVVVALYVLDPRRVTVLVADDGSVFYELQPDTLGQSAETIRVPAREIIHDRFNCLFHPLVGVSPIFASGLAASQGVNIQTNSARFFGNGARPSGILTAPGAIADETAARLKAHWEANYSGENVGKIAVLGDGLKFEGMTMTSVDAQLIEQLRWTAEVICSTFHVPPYKIGIGQMPTYNNIQALNVEYYSQCLQRLIEDAEACLDEGLGLAEGIGTEFDLDGLLRMDTVTQVASIKEAIGAGFMAPNEGRRKLDLKPVAGGDTPYLQEQNWALSDLAQRQPAADAPGAPAPMDEPAAEAAQRAQMALLEKDFREALNA